MTNSNLTNAPSGVPGSIPGSGDGAHFYCGNSSDNLFWSHWDLKNMPSMQNSEWETFYVNWTPGPCVRGI